MKIKMKKKQQGHGIINKHTAQNKKNNNKQQVTIKSKTKCQKQIRTINMKNREQKHIKNQEQ
jgi:hypothetical protein